MKGCIYGNRSSPQDFDLVVFSRPCQPWLATIDHPENGVNIPTRTGLVGDFHQGRRGVHDFDQLYVIHVSVAGKSNKHYKNTCVLGIFPKHAKIFSKIINCFGSPVLYCTKCQGAMGRRQPGKHEPLQARDMATHGIKALFKLFPHNLRLLWFLFLTSKDVFCGPEPHVESPLTHIRD